MFQRLKQKKQQGDSAHNTNKIVSVDLIKKRFIYQLQTLLGVTQNDFQALYVATFDNFERYLATYNQTENINIKNEILTDVIFALKKRQGYLLPVGSDSETSFREAEEWTFAIFVGALLKQADQSNRLNIAKLILSIQAFSWLSRNKKLFALWQDYLKGEKNIFTEIIDASNTLLLDVNKESASDKLLPMLDTVSEKSILPIFTEQDFWQWLRHALEKQHLSVNQADSFVHGTELGLLLVFPKIIDEFYSYQLKALGLLNKTVNLTERIALSKKIKKHESLIRSTKGSRIHCYCINQWEDRKVISGILIKPDDFLLNDKAKFPINTRLTVDPISLA